MRFKDIKVGWFFSMGGSYFIRVCKSGNVGAVCVEGNSDYHTAGDAWNVDNNMEVERVVFTGVHQMEGV